MSGKWVREGECNHCGVCCTLLSTIPLAMTIQVDAKGEKPDYWHAAVRGMQLKDTKSNVYENPQVFIYAPCREFDMGAQRCKIHPDKPPTCIAWPTEPEQVKHIPQCSYTFKWEEESC